jgi:hypothetical protein
VLELLGVGLLALLGVGVLAALLVRRRRARRKPPDMTDEDRERVRQRLRDLP